MKKKSLWAQNKVLSWALQKLPIRFNNGKKGRIEEEREREKRNIHKSICEYIYINNYVQYG